MDWIWRTRSANDSIAELAHWEQRPFTPGVEHGPHPHDKRDNHERVVGSERPGNPEINGIARRVADAILRFDIFPPDLLAKVVRRTPIEVGDTVGLRYYFLPGLDLFFAARVIDRFEKEADGLWRCGFTYRTLQGHPECGEETFVVEKNLATGKVTAALRSWSRPGIWLARLTYPLIRRWQLRAGAAALDHLERIANPAELSSTLPPMHSFLPRRDLRTGMLRSDGRW